VGPNVDQALSSGIGLVFGKFAPFHNGHEMLIREALEQSDKVIVSGCV